MKLEFHGKNVLVTGGNSGIGLCLAELLIHSGLYPVLAVRNEKKRKAVDSHLAGYAGKYGVGGIDFSRMASVGMFMDAFDMTFDYLVDLFQSDYESMVAASNPDFVTDYMTANITVRAELLRVLSRQMLKQRFGRMLFISSVAAAYPGQGQGFYAASKLASEALYKNIGLELGVRGVTTFSIRPGYVDSGRGARFLEKRPVHCVVEKRALCETILFFLSGSGEGFNAGHVVMDGGLSSGKPKQSGGV